MSANELVTENICLLFFDVYENLVIKCDMKSCVKIKPACSIVLWPQCVSLRITRVVVHNRNVPVRSLSVCDKMLLKINRNGKRHQIVQVTRLFFHFAAGTCQTKRFFKQTYVHFLGSNLFASCTGTRVHGSNWLENCQLCRHVHAQRTSCVQSGDRDAELQTGSKGTFIKLHCVGD